MCCPFIHEALFQLDLEHAHKFTLQQLHHTTGTPFEVLVQQKVPTKPVNCTDLMFRSPLSLAAGLDKDGKCIDALGAMRLGSIEIGTVIPRLQPGNDKSRLFRLVDVEDLIDRMGFNNLGADNLIGNVKKAHYDGVLGINTSENKDTPVERSRNDYLIHMEKIYTYTGYIVINISSPNTPGLRTLQYGEALGDLLTAIRNKQSDLQTMHHKYIPVAVKIVSDLSKEELIQVADSSVRHNTNGVTAANITLDRSLVRGVKSCDQTSGLSSRPLQLKSTEIIRRLSLELNGRSPIIGVGDIDSIIAAREKIAVGTSLVQIYSGFTSKGPPLIKEIVTYI